MQLGWHSRVLIYGLGMVVMGAGCSPEEPPEPPSSLEGSFQGGEAVAVDRDQARTAASLPPAAGGEAVDESKLDTGIAPIGPAKLLQAMGECHGNFTYFDRFDSVCTTHPLARLDCTVGGIKKHLTPTQMEQFEASLKASYAGWSVDQCVDCPPGQLSRVCQSSSGATQAGTKVLFVKDDEIEFRQKAIVIPTRPGRP